MRTALARLLRIIVLLTAAAALAGCSAVKLGYGTLPDLVYWWLDGYIDFSNEQSPRVHEELARLQAWHRATELPPIADLIGRIEQQATVSVTPAQVCVLVPEIQLRLSVLERQAEPAIAALAASLSPRQLRHIERKFAKRNAEFRKDRVDAPAADRLDKRFKEALDRLENIYGSLDEPQREVLRRALADSIFDGARSLAERQRRQQDMLQILQRLRGGAVPPAEARELVHGWFERVLHAPDPAYRRYQDALLEEGCRTFAAVHASTTPQQRAEAARRLRAWQSDLRDLATQAP